VKRIVTGEDRRVAAFVASQTEMGGHFGSCTAIGLERDGEIVAGVVYENFSGRNVECHIAAVGKHWMTREFLWFIFFYPFEQVNAGRITVVVDDSNEQSMRFVENLGFEVEAKLEDAGRSGDLLIYRMFKKNCRFLRMKRHG
jgi:RimJ/RimL family protein N-acetyltransferase